MGQRHLMGAQMPKSSGKSGASPGRCLLPASAPSFTRREAPCSGVFGEGEQPGCCQLRANTGYGVAYAKSPSKTQKMFWILQSASRPAGGCARAGAAVPVDAAWCRLLPRTELHALTMENVTSS